MRTVIGALFETDEAVNVALEALNQAGIPDANTEAVGEMLDTPPGRYGEAYAMGGADEMAAELEEAGLTIEEADFFAQGVARGRMAVLILDAPGELASKALEILAAQGGQIPEDVN